MERRITTSRAKLLLIMLSVVTSLMAQTSFTGAQILPNDLVPLETAALKANSKVVKSPLKQSTETVTMQDLIGDYVFSYTTSLSGMFDGKNGVSIKAKTENTITLQNFWQGGTIEATVDFAANTITIIPQKLGTHATFGNYDIRTYTVDGKTVTSSATNPIVGTISKNGITLTSPWGAFITSGEDAGKYFNLYSASVLEKANAKMVSLLKDNSIKENPVIVKQLPGDSLQIINFANYGCTIYVNMHENSSISFLPQVSYQTTDASNKKLELYCYKVDYTTNTYYKTEPIRGIGTSRSLTWDNWFIASSDAKLVLSQYLSSTIILNSDIQYPTFPFEGKGTEDEPYLMKTKQDLLTLSKKTTEKLRDCGGMYFSLENDIDMELDESFIGIAFDNNRKKSFAGIFDGNGHAIRRMKMNNVVWNGSQVVAAKCKSDIGFIANLATSGVVKNLTIASDCEFQFWAGSGAVVGYNSGTIENCKNYANMNGVSCWIGGIAGTNLGLIKNCYNAGTIKSGFNTVGGIVGRSTGGIITGCQNDGAVSAEVLSTFETSLAKIYAAGGIAGYSNGLISDVVNTGTIKAPSRAGGIVAMCSPIGSMYTDVSNAVNYGLIFANVKNESGGVIGIAQQTGKYENCYSDGQIVSYGGINNKNEEGCTAVETDSLLRKIKNFDVSIWNMQENYYPLLKKFSNELAALAASKIFIRLAKDETVGNIKSPVTLNSADGLSWKLKNGTAYSITGSTLSLVSPALIVRDTLIATIGSYSKAIPLTSVAKISLQGEGTKENPYQINAPEEWNLLAQYIKESGKNFEGEYFRLTTDLDFTEKEFQPIAIVDAAFQGYFDGNGKKILNLNYNAGTTAETAYRALFGTIGPKGTIANLTLESGSITGYSYIGGIVSDLYGTVSNCVNKATITTNGGPTAAGIVVYARGDAAVIKDCINYGTISTVEGKGYAAGVVNSCDPGTVIENCVNEGNIKANGNYAAGIVCYGYGPTVNNCRNTGEIVSTGKYAGGIIAGLDANPSIITNSSNKGTITAKNNAGGILGQAFKPSASESRVENCYNEGSIITSDNYVGGIAGYLNKNFLITGCYNTGDVKTEKAYAGGIVGQIATLSASQPLKIHNCYNTGKVSSVTMNAAGIAADAMDYMAIDSCYNTGEISTKKTAGGISSNIKNVNNPISNCWNAGNVTVEESIAGGIIGSGIFAAPISGCFNVGTIKSTGEDSKTAYGIGGLAGTTKATFTNCYNMGKVEGCRLIAGLVGSPAAGSMNASTGKITYGTSFNKCYNMGEILVKDTLGGNVVGNVVAYLFFDQLYALDQKFESDSVAALTTKAAFAKLNMGEGWIKADYAYPYLTNLADNDYAPFYATTMELAEGDTITNVTQDFHVGTPGRVVWRALTDNLQINGSDVSVKAGAVNEEAILVAEIGGLSKQVTLTLNTPPDNIANTASDKEITGLSFYTIDGIKISELNENQLYIVVKTYKDGTTETVKGIKR